MDKLTAVSVKNSYRATYNHYCKLCSLSLILLIYFLTSSVQAKYGGGTGEPNNPYRIATAADLNDIGNHVEDFNKCFVMVNDVNLSEYTGTQFNIIGIWNSMWDPNNKPFSGVFDGDGHMIVNFGYAGSTTDNIGLFRAVGFDYSMRGEIRNVVMVDPNVQVQAANNVGSLVGFVWEGAKVLNCHVEAGSVRGANVVGGLVGANYGKLAQCGTTCNVTGVEQVGGLAGFNRYAEYYMFEHIILNCYSGGSVSGVNDVGGLVGWNERTIMDSYAQSDVSGNDSVAGLVGKNMGFVFNCYSSGSVTANISAGGLIATGSGPTVSSFWDVNSTGQQTSSGGIGKSTIEMYDPNTYISAGWDFVDANDGPDDIWAEPNETGYPILWWQQSPMPIIPGLAVGSGKADDPYLISTPEGLNRIASNPRLMRAHLKLTVDLDLTGFSLFTIGDSLYRFEGVFDGDGHTISNLSSKAGGFGEGLFSYVDGSQAHIKNLGLIDVNIITGSNDTGALVQYLGRCTVSNCWVAGGSISGLANVGGLIGINRGAILTDCRAAVTVSGEKYVGGLVGLNSRLLSNCFATGDVSASAECHGGLTGWNYFGHIDGSYATGNVSGGDYGGGLVGRNYYGTISDSYSRGSVIGAEDVGGLVGNNDWSGSVISRCYSVGTVTGTQDVGGLVGSNDMGIVEDCFWDTENSNRANMCGSSDGGTGCNNGNGKTTAEMMDPNIFLDAGWDFVGETVNGPNDIWKICDGTNYPKLWWQFLLGDFVCPDGVDMRDFAVLAEQWQLEKLSADVAPDGGDGIVNFLDWAVFANTWPGTEDMSELAVFAQQWLRAGASCCDIAPVQPDGIINALDLAAQVNNWLVGVE
ncbi:MAG: GLUG motif-containing protein [Planctomycetota bacterium]|jgi:hypothetical protein